MSNTTTNTPTEGWLAEVRETLRLYAASGERVRIGWTLSDGRADKPMDVYPAAEAQYVLDTLEGVCESTGLTIQSLTVLRLEGGLFLDDEPAHVVQQPTAEQALDEGPDSPLSTGLVLTRSGDLTGVERDGVGLGYIRRRIVANTSARGHGATRTVHIAHAPWWTSSQCYTRAEALAALIEHVDQEQ